MEPKIVVHGGTAKIPAENEPQRRIFLKEAVKKGIDCLRGGGTSIDAVCLSVRMLEDSGLFEAGVGSSPQLDGIVRYDASLMSCSGRAGGVIGIVGVKSAIEAARRVFDKPIEHTTLAGESAALVLRALGMEVSDPPMRSRSVDECVRDYLRGMPGLYGTVGAVAIDQSGLLAAATSTGGYRTALPGRTGDSGIVSAGTYATTRCALSCTGNGDRIVPSGIAVAVDAYLECGLAPSEAVDRALTRLAAFGGEGGFIFLSPDGQIFVRANVPIIRVASSHISTDVLSVQLIDHTFA